MLSRPTYAPGMPLRTFASSAVIAISALVLALVYGGPAGLGLAAVLGILEISLSFDNAVVNATVLQRMDAFWQKVFLTVGMVIAVLGMRLVFPMLIVGVTAHLTPAKALRLALKGGSQHTPGTYAYLLHDAHPAIAAFGAVFLMSLFLDFVFEDREVKWLYFLEKPLVRIGRVPQLSTVVALGSGCLAAYLLAPQGKVATVLVAGALGLISYILLNALGEVFETDDEEGSPTEGSKTGGSPVGIHGAAVQVAAAGSGSPIVATGKAALMLFIYLEVLDSSFSFDGVIGAFAITSDPIIIALGLGIGAIFIRSLTVFLVRQGALAQYVYLEHGAHWAIGALAVILLLSVRFEVPDVVTGLIGVGFIGAAFVSSVIRNRRNRNHRRRNRRKGKHQSKDLITATESEGS